MSIARTKIKGIVFLNSRLLRPGFTLFTPVKDRAAYLIDMRGEVVKKWDLPYAPAAGAKLLPDGNLMYMGILPSSPVAGMEGAGGVIQVLDCNGKAVREYQDEYMHHEPIRLVNGNLMFMKWTPLPDDVCRRVKGGAENSEHNGVMYDDMLCELNPQNKIVWKWNSADALSPEEVERCPVCDRDTWLHMNGIYEMANGNILMSYCKASQLAIVSRKNGGIVWRYDSKGELAHQHCPSELEDGKIMVFDNGLHPHGYSTDSTRVLEIDPLSQKVTWAYIGDGGGKLSMYFDSALYSSCQRLPHGNTVICEGVSGRIFEISTNRETVWEYVNPFPTGGDRISSSPVYSAYRYEKDAPELSGITF